MNFVPMELFIYVDGSPSDWFSKDLSTTSHTIALICTRNIDDLSDLIGCYSSQQKGGIKQWKTLSRGNGDRRKKAFNALFTCISKDNVWLNIATYQESELRNSVKFLCSEYGERGIGFESTENGKFKHEFVDFNGYHLIEDKVIKILPLLFLGWLINGMVAYYREAIEKDFPGTQVFANIILNYLSGDSNSKKLGEKLFQQFLTYNGDQVNIVSLKDSPELRFADNLAGIFSECLAHSDWRNQLAAIPDKSGFAWVEFKMVDEQLVGKKVEF